MEGAIMVRNREDAARTAIGYDRYGVGMCQMWTRTVFGAPSVGDVDRDGDADAVDGMKSEPAWAKHTGRTPPRGVPVAFSGGSKGFGHRAVSLGNGKIRSTDMTGGRYTPGIVGTTTIGEIERAIGVRYTGWSETISGIKIPEPPKPPPPPAPDPTRGKYVDAALEDARDARDNAKVGSNRRSVIQSAINSLKKIPFLGRKGS
jgi:hypothetical protein